MGVVRFFARRLVEAAVVILLITFIPNLPPDAKFSEPFNVTPPLPLEGKLALNERLNQAELWHKGDFIGPEDFAEYNGELYTTLHGGDVVKLTGNHITPVVKFGKPCKGAYQERICGRPLGLKFDKSGALFVADAYYGIFKVDIKTGKKLQLVSMDHKINGKKPKLPNSIVLASNGDLYWSDSSTEFLLEDGIFDTLSDGSGRLIHYNAKTKKNTVLMDSLHFANGVALSSDESFVIVAETVRSRIHRYYLKGPKKGTSDIFIDGLPGLPDNLGSDGDDGFWVPLVLARDDKHPSALQMFGPFPLIRKFFARVLGLIQFGFRALDQLYPNEYCERGIHWVGHFTSVSFLMHSRVSVLHLSKNGDIIDSLHALDKRISGISEAFIFKDHLYLGSPFNDYIARVPLAKAGLKHLVGQKQQTQSPPKQTTQLPPTTTTKPPTTTTRTTQAPPPPPSTTRAPPPPPPSTTRAPPPPPPTTRAPPPPPPSTTRAPPPPPPSTTRASPPSPPSATQPPTTTTPKPASTTTKPVKQQPPSTAPTPAPTKPKPTQNAPPPPKQPSSAPPAPKQSPPKESKTVPNQAQPTEQPKANTQKNSK